MRIKPTRVVELEHRAYYLAAVPQQGVTIAGDEQGRVSVIRAGEAAPAVFSRPWKLRDLAVHPTQPLIAFVEEAAGEIVITDLAGTELRTINAPAQADTTPEWVKPGFGGCFFSANGDYLWCAAALDDGAIEVQMRDCAAWQVQARIEIEDPFGGSNPGFYATPDADGVALWLAAGQDGQQIYWLKRTPKSIQCKIESVLEDTTPPVFAPQGNTFLAVVEDALCRYTYPHVRLLGQCGWENGKDDNQEEENEEEQDEEEDSFSGYICFLDERFAMTSSSEGRLFLVNVAVMKKETEVVIEGHAPIPAEQMYPALKGDLVFCADLSYFQRFGNEIVSVHRRSLGVAAEEWKDTLLFFDINDLAIENTAIENTLLLPGLFS